MTGDAQQRLVLLARLMSARGCAMHMGFLWKEIPQRRRRPFKRPRRGVQRYYAEARHDA